MSGADGTGLRVASASNVPSVGSSGALAASAVLRFRSNARAPEFEALQQAVAGDDLPLLRGLAFIVEPTLGEGVDRA